MTSPPDDFLDDPRFSRTFELPADPSCGRDAPFKIKYADYGYRNEAHPEQEHALLFFSPLMGSRLLHVAKDALAKRHKTRIICPDRPGIGGTDPVDAKDRLRVSREVVIELLRHLRIQHVFIACHSGGTVYALDMLVHHPEILHPEMPYLAIGAPWILPSHTGSKLLLLARSLPVQVLGQTDTFIKLINNHIGPMIGMASGLGKGLAVKLGSSTAKHDRTAASVANEDADFEERIWDKVIERIYEEGVRGLSPEAILLLQKVNEADGWGDWRDYDTLVPRLVEALRSKGSTLNVDVFYAEKDLLIGDGDSKGPLWFDQCWNVPDQSDAINYHRKIIKGSDHNSIWSIGCGTVQQVLARIDRPVKDSPSTSPNQ